MRFTLAKVTKGAILKKNKEYFSSHVIPFLIWLGIIILALWLEFSGHKESAPKHAKDACEMSDRDKSQKKVNQHR